MDRFLRYARQKQKDIIALTRELVECESPSDDRDSVNRFVELMADQVSSIANIRTFPGGKFGEHLRCEFLLPGPKKRESKHILALGHSDTVWTRGTLRSMPFREAKGRLWGPGVLDMKAGMVFFIFAMHALRDLDIPVARKVILQVNSDEEVGSESSRPLTEEGARNAAAVLVLEPGTGLTGKLKTARKGVGDYTITVRGVASHAGVDFSNGASAIIEMARQLQRIAGFTRLDRGATGSPGAIHGGTRSTGGGARGGGESPGDSRRRGGGRWGQPGRAGRGPPLSCSWCPGAYSGAPWRRPHSPGPGRPADGRSGSIPTASASSAGTTASCSTI